MTAKKFEFPEFTTARCTNVNIHPVNHGEEKSPFVEIDLKVDLTDQRDLDKISPGLRAAIFHSVAGDAGQTDLPGTAKVWPDLNFPDMMMPLKFDRTLQGWRFECDYGLGEDADSNIVLATCKVKALKVIEVKKGGSASIGFQVQSGIEGLDDNEIGKLGVMACKPSMQFKLSAPEAAVEDAKVKSETKADPRQQQLDAAAAAGVVKH